MIIIWNRKEVFVGNSIQKFSQIRNILESNKIKYNYRIVNRNKERARIGTFGEKLEYAYEYYIYVHRYDYDNACSIINKF